MMKLPRRKFLRLAAGAAAVPAVSRTVSAQSYPSRPVRIVVGFGPGSSPDIVARLIGQWLSERLGQPFIIDNKPGAGTNIATEVVVRSPADGYTLLWATTPNAINATFYDKLKFNFVVDIAPVVAVIRLPNVMLMSPSVPAKTVPEFIAYAKANPDKINMASAVVGGVDHVAGELFKMMSGISMVHVPYRGGGASLFADLLSGQVQVSFPATAASLGYIRAGRLHALAITTAMRSPALPGVPTVSEFVPGYEASAWHGVGAPKNTPAGIVARLNEEINAGLADPKIAAQLSALGGTAIAGSPSEFGKLIAEETEKWGKVITFAGIRAD
jgi:tripartite-type tricarboxylate transporter receptor subunit TctC